MKKFLAVALLALLISSATATSIESETVEINLDNNKVTSDLEVRELTHSTFTYITAYSKENVNVEVNGEEKNCEVNELSVGSEVRCNIDEEESFNVKIEFNTNDLVAPHEDIKVFRYSHSIYRPTDEYNLRVLLPSGSGLIDQGNITTPVVVPEDFSTGSDGRQIFLEWSTSPALGETLNYEVMFDQANSPLNYTWQIATISILAVSVILISYMSWRRRNLEELESFYDELSSDEIEIVELLKASDGEMLQKDIVNQSEYSKAKISGVVSGLVEKEIVEKQKDGRSNKITLSKNLAF